ncbi:MAG: hypothetical protein ACKOE3_07835 [Betaproteobacteria bacterium]
MTIKHPRRRLLLAAAGLPMTSLSGLLPSSSLAQSNWPSKPGLRGRPTGTILTGFSRVHEGSVE